MSARRRLSHEFCWDDAAIQRLKSCFLDGWPVAKIGRDLGCSKNAVIGKISRLAQRGEVERRPNPVRRLAPGEVRKHKVAIRPPALAGLVKLKSIAPAPQQAATTASGDGGVISDPGKRVGPSVPPLESAHLPPTPLPAPTRPAQQCCWPLGDPRRPGFRFCDAPQHYDHANERYRSYCAEHCAVAYVRVAKMRDISIHVAV